MVVSISFIYHIFNGKIDTLTFILIRLKDDSFCFKTGKLQVYRDWDRQPFYVDVTQYNYDCFIIKNSSLNEICLKKLDWKLIMDLEFIVSYKNTMINQSRIEKKLTIPVYDKTIRIKIENYQINIYKYVLYKVNENLNIKIVM